MQFAAKALASALFTMALALPAVAFEALLTDLAIIETDPTDPASGYIYTAPSIRWVDLGRDDPTLGPTDRGLSVGLLAPGEATQMTGVDFSAITAVFSTGSRPHEVTIVHGAPAFAAKAPEVLTGRGFEETEVAGFSILATGEDLKVNVADVRDGDPFRGGLGKSYRLAISETYLVRTFSWADLNRVIDDLHAGKGIGTEFWRDMVRGVEASAGPGATLEGAIGFTVAAVVLAVDLIGPDGKLKIPEPESDSRRKGDDLPPFGFATFAVTRAEGVSMAHIAIVFASDAMADRGAKVVAKRLEALFADDPDSGLHSVTTKAMPSAIGSIGTVSVSFDPETPNGGAKAALRWINMLYRREFTPLAL